MRSLRPVTRLLPLVVLPLVVLGAVGYVLVSTGGSGGTLPLARGASGGTFHPVAGGFEPDGTQLEGCGERYSCLERAFGNIAYRRGPRRALALFEERMAVDPHVERDCHRIAHVIGSAVFARNEGDVARTFATGSSVCASGYYHGILERAFAGVRSEAGLGRIARSLCVGLGIRRRGFLDYQCRHGLGHGLMIQTGYDLPLALATCGRLGTGWDEVTCASGAFMENVSTRFGFRSAWLSEDDPLHPCGTVPTRLRRPCYGRATTWALQLNRNDFEATAETCAAVGDPWARFCFRGFGRDAVVEAKYADVSRVLELCELAAGYRPDCLYGAARTFSDGAALQGARRAAAFCRKAPAADRDACVAGFGLVVGLLRSSEPARRETCAELAPRSVEACAEAAAGEVHPSGRRAWG